MDEALSHKDLRIGRYCFAKVPEQEVSSDIRDRAKEVAAFVCADLHIDDPPKIVWIRPAQPESAAEVLGDSAQDVMLETLNPYYTRLRSDICGGFTPDHPFLRNEIWIRSDRSEWPNLEYAVAHELRHVWQDLNQAGLREDRCRAECDAYPYGYEVLIRYLKARAKLTPAVLKQIEDLRANARDVWRSNCPDTPFEVIGVRLSDGTDDS